jgi:hypothetical protein
MQSAQISLSGTADGPDGAGGFFKDFYASRMMVR